MRKILLDHVSAGFPADENLLKTIDEQREAIVSLCQTLFGEQPVILSGVYLDRGYKENGVQKTVVSPGWVWMRGDIRRVERTVLAYNAPDNEVWFTGFGGKIIDGVYHDGQTRSCYKAEGVTLVAYSNVGGHTGSLFTNYTSVKRVSDIIDSRLRVVDRQGDEITTLSAMVRGKVLVVSGHIYYTKATDVLEGIFKPVATIEGISGFSTPMFVKAAVEAEYNNMSRTDQWTSHQAIVKHEGNSLFVETEGSLNESNFKRLVIHFNLTRCI